MQNLRTHHFNEGPPVITGQAEIGYFVAFEEDRPGVRGRGDTELSAIADLNRAIAAAGEDRDDDEHPLTGQNATEARWDHERKLRNEAA
jgi:predicted RNase H-like HicB family nuclease